MSEVNLSPKAGELILETLRKLRELSDLLEKQRLQEGRGRTRGRVD